MAAHMVETLQKKSGEHPMYLETLAERCRQTSNTAEILQQGGPHYISNATLGTDAAPCLASPPVAAALAGCAASVAPGWLQLLTACEGPSGLPGRLGRGLRSLGWRACSQLLLQCGCPEATAAAAGRGAVEGV